MDHFAPTTVLCPVDFSGSTQRVIDVAASVADRFCGKLHLVHVWRLPTVGVLDGVSMMPSPTDIELLTTSLKEELHRTAESVARPRETVATHLVQGDAAARIVEVATKSECDLIVMGTHGRTGLAHLVMGSVTEHVIRAARIPVLVVPMPRR